MARATKQELLKALVAESSKTKKLAAENTRLLWWFGRASVTQVLRCVCGAPATCIGSYEGNGDADIGCDTCCGHGNEDGWCVRVVPAEPDEDEPASDKQTNRQPDKAER